VAPESLATLACRVDEAARQVRVIYSLFESSERMNAAYDATIEQMGIRHETGWCGDGWPAESRYTGADEAAGRVGCAERERTGDRIQIMTWTDENLLVTGHAESAGVERDELFEWWKDAVGARPG